MKFKINRDHFANGLQQVLNVVGTRATMPILSNVLIEAADGYIAVAPDLLTMEGVPMTDAGAVPMVANPMRLSATPPRYVSAPPRLAEHTREVLQERLGFDENQIETLRRSGILTL